MSVRIPSGEAYVAQVEKEHRWLPKIAPLLPLPIPAPLAKGSPGEGCPFPWSVYRWIKGETALRERIGDLTAFGAALAEFLRALQKIDPEGGSPSGPHNFYRGGNLKVYDTETRQALASLGGRVDTAASEAVWEKALCTVWDREPVPFHGDVTEGNLLVEKGKLSAVIDFGCCGVGDPACDLTIAWTLLEGESRKAFAETMALDPGTWARARGWALWKGLIVLREKLLTDPLEAEKARRVVKAVCAEAALEN